MSKLCIDRVSYPERTPDFLNTFHIDRPQSGSVWTAPVLEIAGWVVGDGATPVAVEILHAGRQLRSLPVKVHRPDVAARYPGGSGVEGSGFIGLVSALGLPAEFRLDVRVAFEAHQPALAARIHGERSPLTLSYEPSLRPLMLTTMGRTGSTWMMTLFAAHPRIAVHPRYPYECKVAQYWLQVLKALSEPAIYDASSGAQRAERWWVGPNPFFGWDLVREPEPGRGLYLERLAELCQRNIDSWYEAVARGQSKQSVCYFAEKFSRTTFPPLLLSQLYPALKEVVLVRDFRDMMCSILAFDEKRGFPGFGRREGEPTDPYVRRLGQSAASLYQYWQSRNESAHLVRYEDLVLSPESTLVRLLDYLELEATTATVDRMIRDAEEQSRGYRTHLTSSSPRASVGRWRRDLDPPLRSLIEEAFTSALDGFGYGDCESATEGRDLGRRVATGRSCDLGSNAAPKAAAREQP